MYVQSDASRCLGIQMQQSDRVDHSFPEGSHIHDSQLCTSLWLDSHYSDKHDQPGNTGLHFLSSIRYIRMSRLPGNAATLIGASHSPQRGHMYASPPGTSPWLT